MSPDLIWEYKTENRRLLYFPDFLYKVLYEKSYLFLRRAPCAEPCRHTVYNTPLNLIFDYKTEK